MLQLTGARLTLAAGVLFALAAPRVTLAAGAGNFPSRTTFHTAASQEAAAPARPELQGTSRRIEAEVTIEPRAAAPGGAVRLRYMISSYEDTDERVRLSIEAGRGWTLLESSAEEAELLLEGWENLEGELYLVLPETARVGDRQLVRLIVELAGGGGTIHAHEYVTVSRRGGAKPGAPVITGTATAGLSHMGAGGLPAAQKAAALTMSTRFGRGRGSTFSLFYDRGLRANLTNLRFERQRTTVSGTLRHAGWDVRFGNYVSSQGHALAGPYVLGRGVSLARTAFGLLVELVAVQPNTMGGLAGGHLLRGRIGVTRPGFVVAFSASEFGRPVGGYTTLPSVQESLVDVDEEERLDRERQVTAGAAANEVAGIGVDAELRPSSVHRLAVRAGGLRLSNAAGAHVSGIAAEASYTYTAAPATLSVRWRQMPPTVQGISILADDFGADGSLRLKGPVRLVGNAYSTKSETVDGEFASSGQGSSFGLRLAGRQHRLDVRASYRVAEYSVRNVRRTISVSLGAPMGPLSFTATADLGRQENGSNDGLVAYYRGDLRWIDRQSSATLSVSHAEGVGARRQRVDLMLSLKVRPIELAGGAWTTRGYASGGSPGTWTSVGFPIGGGRFLIVGIDYSSPGWTAAAPALRGVLAVRQGFTFSLPFVRNDWPASQD